MSEVVDFVLDPFGINDAPDEAAPEPAAQDTAAPGVSDTEAQELAKKRLFRSGTVFTNTLGEDVTEAQKEGTRLI